MILKFGMKPWKMKLYKVYINHDPVMTLTYVMAWSTYNCLAIMAMAVLKSSPYSMFLSKDL